MKGKPYQKTTARKARNGETVAFQTWDDTDDATLADLVSQGYSHQEIADRMGRTRDSVRNRWGRLNRAAAVARRLPVANSVPQQIRMGLADEPALVAPLVGPEAEPDDAFLSRVVGRTEARKQEAVHRHHGEIVIATDKPIGISFSSDWHLDTTGACDVQGLLQYADLTARTDGLYAVGFGDYTDNQIKHKPQNVGNVPDDLRLFDLVLTRFRRKMLALATGNHDDWTVTFAGVDSVKALAKRHATHFAPDELFLTVRIVDPLDPATTTATWRVLIRHQFRRHSSLNWTHAAWRYGEEFARNFPTGADGGALLPHVIALGHHHSAAVETRHYPSGPCIAIRTGAWKLTDRHSRAFGFGMSVPTAPVVIFPTTNSQDPHAFADYEVGAQFLSHLRGQHEP